MGSKWQGVYKKFRGYGRRLERDRLYEVTPIYWV
jgi:hypothetical protein